jgi:protocatechuate 3,4-dioxygenase beta subunit
VGKLRRWGIVSVVSSILAADATAANARAVCVTPTNAAACAMAANVAGGRMTAANAKRSSQHEGEQGQQPEQQPEQRQEQGQEGKGAEQSGGREFSIGGMVVDSATGKPVGHALVGLDVEGAPPMRRVMTGEDGRFEITGIRAAGHGSIEAWKPGYSSPRRIRTDRYRRIGRMQSITVEPGADVTIRLTPEATIAGQVVDENGEPIEGLPIELVFEAAEQGRRILRESDRTTTNEEGRFRFANLFSGRYFVAAGPSEEVASRNGENGHTALGYPEEFYGGGSDASTASPIDLRAGRHIDLDMRLALEPMFHVTGTISGNPVPGHPDLRILNAAQQRVGQTYLQDTNREFQIALLPRGSYTIRSSVINFDKKQCAVAVKHLDLTRDVVGLHLAMAPCATIPVNVHVEHSAEGVKKDQENDAARAHLSAKGVGISNQPYAARVSLFLKDDPTPFSRLLSQSEKDDEPNAQWIRNVEPGAYRMEVTSYGRFYVEAAQSGLTDLQREDLVVAEGSAVPPIEVRLRDDGAQLEGTITGGDTASAAVAIAIPENRERYAKIAIFQEGKYHFRDLAPGTYRILAVDRVDDFAYAERDVMAKYLAQSKEVNLNPNEKTTADLEFVRVDRGDEQ